MLLLLKTVLLRLFIFKEVPWTWDRVLTDAVSIMVLLSIAELITPSKRRSVVYWSVNLIFSLILFASAIYYGYFGSLPTYTALGGLGQVHQVRGSISTLIRPEYFLFYADLLVMAAVWVANRIRGGRRRSSYYQSTTYSFNQPRRGRPYWHLGMVSVLVAGILLSGLIIRKGWGIENELVRAANVGFVNYQVTAALKESEVKRALAAGNINDTIRKIHELKAGYPYGKPAGSKVPKYFGAGSGKHLLIVQIESLQTFPLKRELDGQPITPVMNALAEEGLYFPQVYQQIGQGNTSDAEFMTNTSIYPIGSEAMSSGFGDRELPSLPKLLKNQGYESGTFHVNDVKFWSRNLMYPALGFDRYYDKPNFKNDHFNDFGASDEELYRVGIEKLMETHKQNKRYYGHLIAVSSHSPFTVPQSLSKISIPDHLKGTQLGNYIDSVNYSDYALGKLIDGLKANGVWDDTVLVVYGDHFGINPNDTSSELIESSLGVPYHDKISRFNIPLIIRVPGIEQGAVIEQTGGQLDILPTVANIMGVSLADENFTALGNDLLNVKRNVFGMRYYLPSGSFFNNEVMFVPGNGFEDGMAISLKTLEPVQDITRFREDYEYTLKLMKLSDEYVKLLPKRAP